MKKHILVRITFERILITILALVIVLMTIVWQPWNSLSSDKRSISVVGTGTVSATPDKFTFMPTYQDTGTDKQKTLNTVNTKVNTVISELKKLGVPEDNISLSGNVYNAYWEDNKQNTVSVSLNIEVSDKQLAQKVQDYILTTTPYGQLTPYPSFTEEKQKSLEADARKAALQNAKSKAELSTSELGAKVGKVVKVSESSNIGIMPMYSTSSDSVSPSIGTTLPISSDKQEVTVSIEVEYELR